MASAAALRSIVGHCRRLPARHVAKTFGSSRVGQLGGFARGFSDTSFSKTHEWLRVDGDERVMGISDFAQTQLGEVVYCDLPNDGATFKAEETICTLESVKAVGEVYAPADCEVVAVNARLGDEPSLVNNEPEGDGWLLKLKITSEPSGLMDRASYAKHCEAEAEE
eukprot:TRINITY_DN44464_c0_g1_i1.p1 TRINITY_DN44464_c0_g1~~TRINITY_DN44464_c0_g1_i1.p1  ORF type:complete len:166 (+),score=27.74 TRINITY_DN44464_c0_g1_i1:65-562(+)